MSIIVRSFFHFYLFYHLYGSISSCSPSNIYIVLFMSTSMSIYFCPAFYCQFPKLTMLKSSPDLLHLILSSESEGSHDVLIEKGILCNKSLVEVTFCTWKKRPLMEIHLFFQYISTSSENLQKLQPVMCVYCLIWILFGKIVGNQSFRGLLSLRINFIYIFIINANIWIMSM